MQRRAPASHCFLWAIVVVPLAGSASCLTPSATATGAQPTLEPARRDAAIVIWDGARTPRYQFSRMLPPRRWDGGGGWAACNGKPTCQATFSVVDGAGVEGDRGLKFQGEGPGWIGGGWNWTNWRTDLARDLTRFTKLTFQIRIQAPAENARELSGLSVALSSKASNGSSGSVRIKEYEPAVLDGRWHKITIPLAVLTQADGSAGFDLSAACELRLSTWSLGPKRLNLYLDQIGAEL